MSTVVWPFGLGSSTMKSMIIAAHSLDNISMPMRVLRGLVHRALVRTHKSHSTGMHLDLSLHSRSSETVEGQMRGFEVAEMTH